MSVDSAIKKIGLPTEIVRSGGNIWTYVYIEPKIKNASYDYKAWFMTDSGVVDGDLVLVQFENVSTYYLVVGLVPDERAGRFFKYDARLFRCNRTVTIKKWSNGDFTDSATGVPCLITDNKASSVDSDRAVVVPGFSGKDSAYYMYMQPNSVNRKDKFTDDKGLTLSIANGINAYFAEGALFELQVKIGGT